MKVLQNPTYMFRSWFSICVVSVGACMQLLVNVLYFYGMCNLVKETLLQRYFSQVNWYNTHHKVQFERTAAGMKKRIARR
jgi:hypothetical protein